MTPSGLVTERSTNGVSSSVSVDVLSVRSTSSTPVGGAAVAVLTSVPVAAASRAACTVYATDAPDGRSAVVAIEPVPAEPPHAPPLLPVHVHVALGRTTGSVSVIVAPVASDGPELVTTIE